LFFSMHRIGCFIAYSYLASNIKARCIETSNNSIKSFQRWTRSNKKINLKQEAVFNGNRQPYFVRQYTQSSESRNIK
jgi:hypothetical protein